MNAPIKILIILSLGVGTIYSLSPMLRSLSDGPDLTPEEFEEVLATTPPTAQSLVKRLDDYRVTNKLEPYGYGRNIIAIRKGIEEDTEKYLDQISEVEIMSINWYDEELPSRIEALMQFHLTGFEDKREGKLNHYTVYLDADHNILGWRKK